MLSSNYQRHDWLRFIGSLTIIFLIPGILFFFLIHTFFIPTLEVTTYFLEYINENEIISGYWDYIQDSEYPELDTELGYNINFLYLLMTLVGPIGISLWFSFKVWTWSGMFFKWICDKLDTYPRMKLVVFWNGKPVQQTRLGKWLSK